MRVGGERGPHTLCAFGEDEPRWAVWVEEILDEARRLNNVAERVGLKARLATGSSLASDIGVDFTYEPLERELCEGYVQVGWIRTRSIGRAVRSADRIFAQFKKQLLKRIQESDFDGLD